MTYIANIIIIITITQRQQQQAALQWRVRRDCGDRQTLTDARLDLLEKRRIQ